MQRRAIGKGVGVGGVLAILAVGASAAILEEVRVTLDQLPSAVKDTVLKESAGAKITEIEMETKNGKTSYEAEFLAAEGEVEIKIDAEGKLLGRVVETKKHKVNGLTLEQMPEPARMALLRQAAGATITEVESDQEHGVVVYEGDWSANGISHEAAVTADGTLLEIEEAVSANQVPPAVQAAIMKHYGAGAKVVVERIMVVVYEVEGRVDGKPQELLISPTGQVQDDAGEEDDDDDDDHDDDDDDDDHDDDDDDDGDDDENDD